MTYFRRISGLSPTPRSETIFAQIIGIGAESGTGRAFANFGGLETFFAFSATLNVIEVEVDKRHPLIFTIFSSTTQKMGVVLGACSLCCLHGIRISSNWLSIFASEAQNSLFFNPLGKIWVEPLFYPWNAFCQQRILSHSSFQSCTFFYARVAHFHPDTDYQQKRLLQIICFHMIGNIFRHHRLNIHSDFTVLKLEWA